MREHYNFSKMKGRRNPYAKLLKTPITIRLDKETIQYFKSMAMKIGVPYQSLINLYLKDCVESHRKLKWAA